MSTSIELTKEIAASPEEVFRALTEADELSRWWTTSADSDARTGGAFEYRFEFPAEPERNHTYKGSYDSVVPNERVAYPWQGRLGDTRVEVTVEASGDGMTALRLVHSGWGEGGDWPGAVRMHEDGWAFFVGNLQSYLERGEDRRADALGMRTPAAIS